MAETIMGTVGADTIAFFSKYTFVQALGGRDYIYNRWTTTYSTIDAGDGNNTIKNTNDYLTASGWDAGNYLSINGGAGNDSVYNTGSNVTIVGGADKSINVIDKNDNSLKRYTQQNNLRGQKIFSSKGGIFFYNSFKDWLGKVKKKKSLS